MKLLCCFGGLFIVLTGLAQQGTPKGGILTQTRSEPRSTARSVGTTGNTTGATINGTTTGTTTSTTGTSSIGGGSTSTTGGTGTIGGTGTSATTATPGTTTDTALSGPRPSEGNPGDVQLQNTTNMFGRIVGITNVQTQAAGGANLNPTQGQGTLTTGGGGGGATGGGTGVNGGTVVPGFTQVTITLEGNVASEVDRQVILNRFQGLPGFVVIDQLNVAGQNQNGTTLNEAAGADTTGQQP
jgi:hypothetical protein